MSQENKPLGPEYRQYLNMVRRAIIEQALDVVFSEHKLAVWAIQCVNTWGYHAKTFISHAIALRHISEHSEALGRKQYVVNLPSIQSLSPQLLKLCLDHGMIERVCATVRNPSESERTYTGDEVVRAIADTARMDIADLKESDISLVIGELIAFDFLRQTGDGLYEITSRGYKANGIILTVSTVAVPTVIPPVVPEQIRVAPPAGNSPPPEAVFPWKDGGLAGMSTFQMERLKDLFRATGGKPFGEKGVNPQLVGYSSKGVLRLFLASARKAKVLRFVSKGDKDLHEWVMGS